MLTWQVVYQITALSSYKTGRDSSARMIPRFAFAEPNLLIWLLLKKSQDLSNWMDWSRILLESICGEVSYDRMHVSL